MDLLNCYSIKLNPLSLEPLPPLIDGFFNVNTFVMEEWKAINGFENYRISNYGNVINNNNLIMSPFDNGKGYLVISLTNNNKRKNFYVHRLVAQAFIPNPENKPQINHIDCDKSNNHVSNLEWCTLKENMKHASDNGLLFMSDHQKKRISEANTGSGHGNTILKEKDILDIRKMREKGMTYSKIAKRYGVHRATIGYIIRGKTWTHV